MGTRIRAVLLDAGDTLLELRGRVGEVYARCAERHGAHFDPDELERRFRAVFPAMPPLSFGSVPPSALIGLERRWWQRLVSQVLPADSIRDFPALFDDLFAHFAEPEAWQLFADALPAIEELRRRGLQLAVVSNFDARLFRICDELGIAARVQTVIASSRIGYAKPDARIFQLTLRRLGVAPQEALHVGDSLVEDFEGARSAGLQALRIDRKGTEETPDTITSLLQIVARL